MHYDNQTVICLSVTVIIKGENGGGSICFFFSARTSVSIEFLDASEILLDRNLPLVSALVPFPLLSEWAEISGDGLGSAKSRAKDISSEIWLGY